MVGRICNPSAITRTDCKSVLPRCYPPSNHTWLYNQQTEVNIMAKGNNAQGKDKKKKAKAAAPKKDAKTAAKTIVTPKKKA